MPLHPRIPPHLPPCPICPGSQSTGFDCPTSYIKFPMAIYFNMMMYMFQGFSLKSFHFLLLPLSPKVCSLHLGLIGWPGHSVAGAIFLDSIKCIQFSSVAQSCPTLRAHELQHARPPCPSPTPGVYSNSRLLSRWCHPVILSSVVPFSSCPQSLPASESFPMSQLFTWGGQSTGVSALASVLPKNTQDWSPLEWTGWISLQCKGISRIFSNTTVQKHQFFGAQLSSQSNSHIHIWLLEKP